MQTFLRHPRKIHKWGLPPIGFLPFSCISGINSETVFGMEMIRMVVMSFLYIFAVINHAIGEFKKEFTFFKIALLLQYVSK